MASHSRYVKTFTTTTKKIYDTASGASRTEKAELSVDDKVNAWVRETKSIVLQTTPFRNAVVEKRVDGGLIKKTTNVLVVTYMKLEDYLAAETELRRHAALGDGIGTKAKEKDEKVAVSDEEERRMDNKPSEPAAPTPAPQAAPAVDMDAAAAAAMADDDED